MKTMWSAAAGVTLLTAATVLAGGTVVELDDLKSTAPAAWRAKESKFKTRLHTFVVPKAQGDDRDAEIQVIFFGKDSGGGIAENIKRWKGMFLPPEGKTIDEVSKQEEFKVGKASLTVLDVQGIYKDKFPPFDPNAKEIRRPDYRRVNVYFDTDNGPFFIIFVGPAKTVAQNKKAFDDWLKAFK